VCDCQLLFVLAVLALLAVALFGALAALPFALALALFALLILETKENGSQLDDLEEFNRFFLVSLLAV
jgi:hypothetical protein